MRGVPDSEIEAVFAKYDQDGDMMLNAEEQQKLKEDLLKQAEQINKDIEVSPDPVSTNDAVVLGPDFFGPTWILIKNIHRFIFRMLKIDKNMVRLSAWDLPLDQKERSAQCPMISCLKNSTR